MRLPFSSSVLSTLLWCSAVAWTPAHQGRHSTAVQLSSATATTEFTKDVISKLRFRDLQDALVTHNLDNVGTTSQLRTRLREAVFGEEDECIMDPESDSDVCEPALESLVDTFVDESDPDFEFNDLMAEIAQKCEKKHWKAATRKLKKLVRRFGATKVIPESIFAAVLESCMHQRLQGARASEPARKIMEQMAELKYEISEQTGNYCVQNCLCGEGPDATHQGFGGLDTALAMKMALKISGTSLTLETHELLAIALARAGEVEAALKHLSSVISDSETIAVPSLETFTQMASAAVRPENVEENAIHIPAILSLAKASGYDVDTMASEEAGVSLLAFGVVGAEKTENVGLGLRLLTGARKVEGGDIQVASLSAESHRACIRLHNKAISKAVVDKQWKLGVALLQLMLERNLRPAPWVWRSVVSCCARAEKSRKSTGLLLDWVRLSEEGKADQPPLTVFNTVVNACEICNEQELTLVVLESMHKTHETDGNLITFNIALKRLAKLGNFMACEGIILGMLKNGVEPSVVSYTTAIAACANKESKQAVVAYQWLQRMRSRLVNPNVLTYNTAIAACLDGTAESAALASQICQEMLVDVAGQLAKTDEKFDQYTNVLPDSASKMLVRQIVDQLGSNGDKDEDILKPLQAIAEFEPPTVDTTDVDGSSLETSETEAELEFSTAVNTHRIAEV